jgi:polysaccharide biosynthesis protein PslG
MRAGLCLVAVLLVSSPSAAGVLASSADPPRVPNRPLRTAVHLHLPGETYPDASAPAFARVAAAGASVVRLPVAWSEVAPKVQPPGFNAEDPADPAYRWQLLDESVRTAAQYRLEPLVFFFDAPAWAQLEAYPEYGPNSTPDPVEIGRFAKALALRYSGSFQGLPRVRYWQAWNEPNISIYFRPQLVANRPVSPAWYREVLEHFAPAVRSAHADNLIIAGGTAPFHDITGEVMDQRKDWGPLSFMRELLCVSRTLRPTCDTRVTFDAWAHHPYTSGGPTHHAVLPDDVSLGDLPEMKRVLDAAVKAGHITASGGRPEFWVTEFSWDSRPPDPKAVPVPLLQRWVSEALYRMWKTEVTLVTWFTIRDQPMSRSFYQSGLYYRGASLAADRPKPFLQAFRFPVVAFREGAKVLVWGRTPAGRSGQVVVEQRIGKRWARLGGLPTNRYGIFQARFATTLPGSVRARTTTKDTSIPFSLKTVPDRFFNPFGLPTLLEPQGQ